jgi:chromatin assembly factor 1 subunit A
MASEFITGTWTRSSSIIGPRNPFAKDSAVLDYSYDSGEDWEEEEEGEGVLSGSDSDGDASDNDSLDGWLVDDDDDIGGEPINLEDMDIVGYEFLERKRKTSPNLEQSGGKEKKRKFVQPLVPFVKGPRWESASSQCDWNGFIPYRIQFFNDGKPLFQV